MVDGVIYDCPNANCRTPINTGECRKDCIEKRNKEIGIKPQTNGDRIRAMTDEELEASIISVHLGYRPWCSHKCEYNSEHGCDTCISNWLKQPVEEG